MMMESVHSVFWVLIYILIFFAAVTVTAFIVGRAASFGWHRSKWEYLKQVINHTKGEESNGQG